MPVRFGRPATLISKANTTLASARHRSLSRAAGALYLLGSEDSSASRKTARPSLARHCGQHSVVICSSAARKATRGFSAEPFFTSQIKYVSRFGGRNACVSRQRLGFHPTRLFPILWLQQLGQLHVGNHPPSLVGEQIRPKRLIVPAAGNAKTSICLNRTLTTTRLVSRLLNKLTTVK